VVFIMNTGLKKSLHDPGPSFCVPHGSLRVPSLLSPAGSPPWSLPSLHALAILIVFRPSLSRIALFFVADEVLASDKRFSSLLCGLRHSKIRLSSSQL
jgi:hypothetical protein